MAILSQADIVEWLLNPDPDTRPSAEDILDSDKMKRLQKTVKKARDGIVPKL